MVYSRRAGEKTLSKNYSLLSSAYIVSILHINVITFIIILCFDREKIDNYVNDLVEISKDEMELLLKVVTGMNNERPRVNNEFTENSIFPKSKC